MDNQYPLDIDAQQYYKDFEVIDFNEIFRNGNLIQNTFGKSISVSLTIDRVNKKICRDVKEMPDLISRSESFEPCHEVNHYDDPELINLRSNLR